MKLKIKYLEKLLFVALTLSLIGCSIEEINESNDLIATVATSDSWGKTSDAQSVLRSLDMKTGQTMDPDGFIIKVGSTMDPNGSESDNNKEEENGTESGGTITPNG